jgi:hypothetical protein
MLRPMADQPDVSGEMPSRRRPPADSASPALGAEEWLERFAAALSVEPPTEGERQQLLALAGIAAHASERIAAPLTCWLVGRAGVDPEVALTLASKLAHGDEAGGDASSGPEASPVQ